MTLLFFKGSRGEGVDALRAALQRELGADAALYPSLGKGGDAIDDEMDAAIRRWQSGAGIVSDGIVGPRCQLLLGLSTAADLALEIELNVGSVSRLFPATKPANIARYLPYIEASLGAVGLKQRSLVIAALGTIRAETEGFVPISEGQSKYNTPPGGAPFSLYDHKPEYGNDGPGDGAKYRGRGFVQLTWRVNYKTYGERIGMPSIAANPDLANAPEVAAVLLAEFLHSHLDKLQAALAKGDLAAARKVVNGGLHGLDRFSDVFARAEAIWPAIRVSGSVAAHRVGAAAKPAEPLTPARPQRASRTRKDSADIRDREFMPTAISLPDEFPSSEEITTFLAAYSKAGMILDQGAEGACTGFGLSCVVNYLRWAKAGLPAKMESVSPRMLYTLARRHDEYEGENYEGSSCRGAIKGWFNHGVCLESDWPYNPEQSNPAKYGYAERAAQTTLGVYYRVDHKSITDMQAAIAQHRAVFVSAFTHDGWNDLPKGPAKPKGHADVPVIPFDGKPSQTDGHAFALVGFNGHGFILQNSWGKGFGTGGFAVLSYLDWLANGMDAWVVSLGVPGVIAGRLAVGTTVGAVRVSADRSKWWDSGLAYQHSVVFGNDGRVSRYLTADEPPRKLEQQCSVLPDQWFRAQTDKPGDKKRLVLYVHGGLNSEADAIKRASAMGRFFIGNGCYPLFLVWKTGLLESIGDIVSDAFRKEPARVGATEWLTEKTDLVIEKTVGRPLARPVWSEMKENAELAFGARRGGDLLLDALQSLAGNWGDRFELHLVGHSAGSIALGHMLSAMAARRVAGRDGGLAQRLSSVHLYAPACTVAFANKHYAMDEAVMQRLYMNVLSDKVERDDNVVSIYRKSLLYMVSNSLEGDLHTPILGLQRVMAENDPGWDGSSDTGEALAGWRQAATAAKLADRTTIVEADRVAVALDAGGASGKVLQPAAHGSFDNDIEVVARTLERITGGKLAMPVDDLRGF
ncbi:MAG: peptidase [Rhizobacter sp.]|nr:peptidase [Rhizobacter sp.]